MSLRRHPFHAPTRLRGPARAPLRARERPLADESLPRARNFEAMDPLEWLARLSDYIPGPGATSAAPGPQCLRHRPLRTSRAASGACRVGGRLIAKVHQVDPLVCARCGKRMAIIAFVTDKLAVPKILDHLGLSTPEAEKPPPPVREVLRVAEHGDGWGVPAYWE